MFFVSVCREESGKDGHYKQTALSFSDQSTRSSLDITNPEIDLSLQKEIKNKKGGWFGLMASSHINKCYGFLQMVQTIRNGQNSIC